MNLSYIIFFFICHSKTLKWTPILFRIFHLNNKYYLKGSSNLVRIIISILIDILMLISCV